MKRDDGSYRKVRQSYNEPGQAHELTFTCHKRLPLLTKDRTRRWFIGALDQARRRWNFELWAYVIMPEHAHVLLLPKEDEYDISMILKAIKQSVSRRAIEFLGRESPMWLVNLRVPTSTGRMEHRFWQAGGGYDRNVNHVRTAWNAVEYIHNNPVRRGLASAATEWEWSSARFYAGLPNVHIKVDGRPPSA